MQPATPTTSPALPIPIPHVSMVTCPLQAITLDCADRIQFSRLKLGAHPHAPCHDDSKKPLIILAPPPLHPQQFFAHHTPLCVCVSRRPSFFNFADQIQPSHLKLGEHPHAPCHDVSKKPLIILAPPPLHPQQLFAHALPPCLRILFRPCD